MSGAMVQVAGRATAATAGASLHSLPSSDPPTVVARAEKKLTASSEQQADIQSWSSRSGTWPSSSASISSSVSSTSSLSSLSWPGLSEPPELFLCVRHSGSLGRQSRVVVGSSSEAGDFSQSAEG